MNIKNFIQYFLDVAYLNNHPDESLKIKTKPEQKFRSVVQTTNQNKILGGHRYVKRNFS